MKQQAAQQDSQTLLYWYRQHYRLPRHDPRLLELTPEELEYEALLWQAYNQPPELPSDPLKDAWFEALQRGEVDPNDPASVARWRAQHDPAMAPDWEPVRPEEVIARGRPRDCHPPEAG
ncbi:MAG: hypothetical protein K6V97_03850 [Actinomycetia bacterium]|nr:hypothetical protein [Actinomycetes bacterium]